MISAPTARFSTAVCLNASFTIIIGSLITVSIIIFLDHSTTQSSSSLYAYSFTLFIDIFLTRYVLLLNLQDEPLLWLIEFLLEDNGYRACLCLIWLGLILFSVWLSSFQLFQRLPRVWQRKLFHFLMVFMFSFPLLNRDLHSFIILSFGCAIALFIYLEVFRCNRYIVKRFPVLKRLNAYLESFESREFQSSNHTSSKFIYSHMSLLLACSIPVFCWGIMTEVLLLCLGVQDINTLGLPRIYLLLPHLGYIAVGIGDSMAAIVGMIWGKHRWAGQQRTAEGSAAAFVSTFLYLFILVAMLPFSNSSHTHRSHKEESLVSLSEILSCLFVSLIVSFAEICTTNIDDNILMTISAVFALLWAPFIFHYER